MGDIEEIISEILMFITDHKKEINEERYFLYVEVLKQLMKTLENEEEKTEKEKIENVGEKTTKYDKYLEKSEESNLNRVLAYQILNYKEKLKEIEPLETVIDLMIETIGEEKA